MSLAEINADHAAALAELTDAYGRTVTIDGVTVTAAVHTRSRSDSYDDYGVRDIPENITVTAPASDLTAAQLAALDQDSIVALDSVNYELVTLDKTDSILSMVCTKK